MKAIYDIGDNRNKK